MINSQVYCSEALEQNHPMSAMTPYDAIALIFEIHFLQNLIYIVFKSNLSTTASCIAFELILLSEFLRWFCFNDVVFFNCGSNKLRHVVNVL